jgi:tetratricopeptide (TPR) repeat protein
MAMNSLELRRQVAAALSRRDFALAESLCRDAHGQVPAGDLFFMRGVVHCEQGDTEGACRALARAQQELPERADIAYNYGVALQKSGRTAEAVAAWKNATFYAPQNVSAWLNLALGTQELGDGAAACGVYIDALKLHPTDRDLLYNYANLLFRTGDLHDGERYYRTLLELHDGDAKGWINYAMLLKTAGRFAEAEGCYSNAIAAGDEAQTPRAHFNLAHLLLQQQRWTEGFAAYEWRRKLPEAVGSPWQLPDLTAELPRGSRLLLWSDQGLGDAIMFLRFAPLLARRGYRIFAFVQDALKRLAATAPCIERSFGPSDEKQDFDASLPLCSLPHALGLKSTDLWHGPYLSAPTRAVLDLPTKTDALRVGIVWAGNRKHANDANRSMRFADLAALFGLPEIEWYSLQTGDGACELAASAERERVRDLAPYLEDFAATASAMMELDLVVSIDSAPAHLGGALGIPVWTLLPCVDTDWRWQTAGDTTAWYPTMRLFRQRARGAWSDVVSKVADALLTTRRSRLGSADQPLTVPR